MISIIIPLYNPGERLETLLRCIQNQEEKDFEVILIDDGCTDGSEIICDYYAQRDVRFDVIHQVNSGVSFARNRGMLMAKGEYKTFLDADDEIPENYISVLLHTQRETGADVVVCDVVIMQKGKETGRFTHSPSILERREALNFLFTRRNINSGPYAKLYCTRTLNQLQFPPMSVYEDILFVRDVFSNAKRIAVTDRTEYRYIQNNDSVMHQNNKHPSLDIITATDSLIEYICKHPELDPYCLYITISHMMQYAIPLLRGYDKVDSQFVKFAKSTLREYHWSIVKCSAFPWKEKILFLWYAYTSCWIGLRS